jgi:hypothetical protein
MYMLCMKYVKMQAHEVLVLVCNNTHDKLCKTPFVNYITPDG